jgi:plastocyanin
MSVPKSRSSVVWLLALAVCLMTVWLAACTKSSSPTPPTGGGGAPVELSGNLAAGVGTYAHTFNAPGTFNYHCTIHPGCGGLAGTIVVVDPATAIQHRVLAISQSGGSAGVYGSPGTCSALSVSRDTVHTGDTVTWTNNSPLSHNVVSQ